MLKFKKFKIVGTLISMGLRWWKTLDIYSQIGATFQSSWSKGISEMKSKRSNPCSKCMQSLCDVTGRKWCFAAASNNEQKLKQIVYILCRDHSACTIVKLKFWQLIFLLTFMAFKDLNFV
jgi:hypothetical protein